MLVKEIIAFSHFMTMYMAFRQHLYDLSGVSRRFYEIFSKVASAEAKLSTYEIG
jgi:hypothetical protein